MLLTKEYQPQESDLFLKPKPIIPPVDLGGWEMNPTWIKYLKEEPENLGLTIEDLTTEGPSIKTEEPRNFPGYKYGDENDHDVHHCDNPNYYGSPVRLTEMERRICFSEEYPEEEEAWIHFPAVDPESPSLPTQKNKKKKDKAQARTMSKEERLIKLQSKIFQSIWEALVEKEDAPVYMEKELQSLELKWFRRPLQEVLKESEKGISKNIWNANRQDLRFLYIIGKKIEEEVRDKIFQFPEVNINRVTVGKSNGLSFQKVNLAIRVFDLFRPWPKTLDRLHTFTPKELGRLDEATFSMLKLRLIMEYSPDETDQHHPYI
jgi:hypothetical protein